MKAKYMVLVVAALVAGLVAAQAAAVERVSATQKGSLLVFPKVELRWDAEGNLLQDTFLDVTNDYPGDVFLQMYFVNGDAPIAATELRARAEVAAPARLSVPECSGEEPIVAPARSTALEGTTAFEDAEVPANMSSLRGSPTVVYQDTVHGGGVSGSTCITFNNTYGPDGGTITFPPVPDDALPIFGYLYFQYLTVSNCGVDRKSDFANATINGVNINTLPFVEIGCLNADACFPAIATHFYRVDVSSLFQECDLNVATFELRGFGINNSTVDDWVEGATLMVAYCSESSPVTDIILVENPQVRGAGPDGVDPITYSWSGFNAAGGQASLVLGVGNGQNIGETVTFQTTSTPITILGSSGADGLFDGQLCLPGYIGVGGMYDNTIIDVSALVHAGDTTATFTVGWGSDCLDSNAAFLTVASRNEPSNCVPEGCIQSTGACCNRATLTCEDYVPETECVGTYQQWTPATLCADVSPPCGGRPERAHPGHNWVDNLIPLTANEPTYWSALTGMPKGVSPFVQLDPAEDGQLPGRPDPAGSGERVLRGFVIAYAADPLGNSLRWNHLKGDATIVHYGHGAAWEYNAYAFPAVGGTHGSPTGGADPATLELNGTEYVAAFQQLLLDFYASEATPFSRGHVAVAVDTDLTLLPMILDFRQDHAPPVTTKAEFTIWNMNETKFTNTRRCITFWDQRLLSAYTLPEVPNNFLVGNLHSDKGKAQIYGLASNECNSTDPLVTSQNAPLLGVQAKLLSFGFGGDAIIPVAPKSFSGGDLVGAGTTTSTAPAPPTPFIPHGSIKVNIGYIPPEKPAAQTGRSTSAAKPTLRSAR